MVYRIIGNEAYAGTWRYKKAISSKGHGGRRPVEEQIEVPVTAIVSRTVWEAAQAQREHNRKMSPRNCKHEYLLRGMVKCGCEYSMAGKTGGKHRYYECSSVNARHPGLEERTCFEKSVRCDLLEELVWEYIVDIMTDPEHFEQLLLEAQEAEHAALQPRRDQLDLVNDLIAKCEADAAKLARALVNSSGIVGEMLQREMDDVNKRHAQCIKRREILLTELNAERLTDKQIENAMAFRAAVIEGIQDPTFEDKRKTLVDLQVKVIIQDRQAHVICRIPVPEYVIDLRTCRNGRQQKGPLARKSHHPHNAAPGQIAKNLERKIPS